MAAVNRPSSSGSLVRTLTRQIAKSGTTLGELPPSIAPTFTMTPGMDLFRSCKPTINSAAARTAFLPASKSLPAWAASAANDNGEVTGAFAAVGEAAVAEGGFEEQADVILFGQYFQSGRGGGGADLFVGIDQDLPRDVLGEWTSLEGLEGGEHDDQAALGIGRAGTTKGSIGRDRRLLEWMIGRIDRVGVNAEQYPARSFAVLYQG